MIAGYIPLNAVGKLLNGDISMSFTILKDLYSEKGWCLILKSFEIFDFWTFVMINPLHNS